MKKQFLALLLFLAVGLSAGCSREKETSQAPGHISLEFWTLQLQEFEPVLQPMFDAYEKEHPGVTIDWVDIPFSEGEKRTLAAMMSPKPPDVVNLNPDFSAVLASRKAVLNMKEWVKPDVRETYLPVAWQAVSLGDVTFGLPWYLTSSVTFYNKDLLAKAGYTLPPDDFPGLMDLGAKLKKATGAYVLMPTIAESGNFLKELNKLGVKLYDDSGKAIFADQGAAEHLKFWIQMYQRQLVPAESITEGHRAAVNQYQAGTLAMIFGGPPFVGMLEKNAMSTLQKTDVAPQFPKRTVAIDFSTMLLAVPRRSEHPKEAVDFALYMTNAQNQLTFAKKAPVLPSITESLKDPYFGVTPQSTLVEKARHLSAGQLLRAKQAYQIRGRQRDINEIINYHVQSALLGKTDAQTAMRLAQEEVNHLLESK